jgi:hypothetical protein
MAYAAYLRVYAPVSAFREPDRSRWTAYADSPARPRRRDSLVAEHAEAVHRAITTPQVAVPEQESEHAGGLRRGGRPILAGQFIPNPARCDDKYR